jgi:hypothetical protein
MRRAAPPFFPFPPLADGTQRAGAKTRSKVMPDGSRRYWSGKEASQKNPFARRLSGASENHCSSFV